MFTGLIQAVGTIHALSRSPTGMLRIELRPDGWDYVPALGDSIAINGCCLTLAGTSPAPARGRSPRSGPRWTFFAVQETLSKTTLGRLAVGTRVNLEHAATASTLLGGHIVQGHVDTVGRIAHVQTGEDWRVAVQLPALDPKLGPEHDFAQYLAPKGSICVEGVSLTIAALTKPARARSNRPDGFEVALIPTTLERTTLADLDVGDAVNLEFDAIAKTIVHWLRVFGPARREPGPLSARRRAAAARRRK
jgi:riboflavin synthase